MMRTEVSALCVITVVTTVLSNGVSSAAQDAQAPGAAQQQKKTTPAAKPAAPLVTIASDGTLSLTASRPALKAVLGEIAAQTKVPILLSETLEDARVSIVLKAVPIEEALKRLLAPYDAFYLYSAPDDKSSGISSIWVYPRGEGRTLEPVPPSVWASTREIEAQLENPDAGVRSETYETLIERQGERGLATVQRGLVDPDVQVRLATFSAALDAGIEIPASDLHTIVLNDELQYLRVMALEALEGRPEAEAVAESVKNDPDEVIRNHAAQILEALKGNVNTSGPAQ